MPNWDDIYAQKGKYFTEPHEEVVKIVQSFKNRRIKKILDLGCGTGRHLIFLSKQGFELYGFDASPRAISIAIKWLEEERQRANVIQGRMEFPFPYEENFFEAIISIQVIHHNLLNDIRKTVKEMERVLKLHGLVFISFPTLDNKSRFYKWDLKKIESNTYIPHSGPEKGLPHHFFSLDEIPKIFGSFKILKNYIGKTNHRYLLGEKRK